MAANATAEVSACGAVQRLVRPPMAVPTMPGTNHTNTLQTARRLIARVADVRASSPRRILQHDAPGCLHGGRIGTLEFFFPIPITG